MIPRSRAAKVLAAALSLAATGAAMAVGLAPEPVEIAGGSAPVEARLGTSFEDLAVGTLSGEAPSERVPPAPTTQRAALEAPDSAPRADPVPAAPIEPAPQPVKPEAPTMAMPAAPPEAAPKPSPEAAEAESAAPEDRVTAAAPAPGLVDRSRRPSARDPEAARRAEQAPQPTARGNADRSARAGSQTGQREAPVRQAATGQGAQQSAGNAAASTYPGEVMARLSRVPRPSLRARGAATVAFAIDSGGGLARASIARSSGSDELDRAALRLVRRAAPFPAPPRGAQTSFSIRIAGR